MADKKFFIQSSVTADVADLAMPTGLNYLSGSRGAMTFVAHLEDNSNAPAVALMDVDCTPSKARLMPVFRINNLRTSADIDAETSVAAAGCLLSCLSVTVETNYGRGCVYADVGVVGTKNLLEMFSWQPIQPPTGADKVRYVWFVDQKETRRARKTRG